MKKVLVLYESRTGFTRAYAEWIAEAVRADVMPLKELRGNMLQDRELLICGGGICGGSINGLRGFRRIWKGDSERRYVCFATGVSPASEKTENRLKNYNFLDGEKERIPFFYFQGGMAPEKLSPGRKALLTCMKAMIRHRQGMSGEDGALLELLWREGDYSRREQIGPLVQYACGIMGQAESGWIWYADTEGILPA